MLQKHLLQENKNTFMKCRIRKKTIIQYMLKFLGFLSLFVCYQLYISAYEIDH